MLPISSDNFTFLINKPHFIGTWNLVKCEGTDLREVSYEKSFVR